MAENKSILGNIQSSGSAFWIVVATFGTLAPILILLWSIQSGNNNLQASIVAIIISFFIFTGLFLSKLEIFSNGTWRENAFSSFIGFLSFGLLNLFLFKKSLFSSVAQSTFSTITSQFPLTLQFLSDSILIPLAEEFLWIVGIPYIIISLYRNLSKNTTGWKSKFFGSHNVQIISIVIIGSISFALFHVGKLALVSFLIIAMIFRAILIVISYGDWFEKFRLVPAFAIGAHIGNNWVDFGFFKGIAILNEAFFTYGLLVYGFAIAIVVTCGMIIYEKIKYKRAWNQVLK